MAQVDGVFPTAIRPNDLLLHCLSCEAFSDRLPGNIPGHSITPIRRHMQWIPCFLQHQVIYVLKSMKDPFHT